MQSTRDNILAQLDDEMEADDNMLRSSISNRSALNGDMSMNDDSFGNLRNQRQAQQEAEEILGMNNSAA